MTDTRKLEPNAAEEIHLFDRVQADTNNASLQAGAAYCLVSCAWLNSLSTRVDNLRRSSNGKAAEGKAKEPPEHDKECLELDESKLEWPGPIDNSALMDADTPDKLKLELTQSVDFEIVSAEVWQLLEDMYGGGIKVQRQAVQLADGKLQVELYKLRLQACKLSDSATSVSIDASRSIALRDLKVRLCEELDIADDSKVRLWRQVTQKQNESLEDLLDMTLESCKIAEDDMLLLEECDNIEPTVSQPEVITVRPARDLLKHPAGLANLGNTCFMNSSLQCIANVPSLRDFFLSDLHKPSLNVNGRRTEQTQGRLAEGFNALLRQVWTKDSHQKYGYAPSEFKRLVGSLAERFSGYRQQDSMEFLEFLIDGLAEDCNMVKGKKPYTECKDSDGRPDEEVALEAANAYVLRNDSFCNDLFVGFLKSSVVCPRNHESATFEPATSLKLNVTRQEGRKFERTFSINVVRQQLPSEPAASSSVSKLSVAVKLPGSAGSLLAQAASQAGLPVAKCLLAEVYRGRLKHVFEDDTKLKAIDTSCALVLYEMREAAELGVFKDESLKAGNEVIVKESFMSNNQSQREVIEPGMHGTIDKIDSDGDAFVEFSGLEKKQWVLVRNQCKLLNVDAAERRLHPETQKAYCLRELTSEYFKCNTYGGEPCSWVNLSKYWIEEMQSETAVACELLFRRMSIMTKEKVLFGIPLIFTVEQQAIVEQGLQKAMYSAVSNQLVQRFGSSCSDGWKLFQAESKDDLQRTMTPLSDAEGAVSEIKEVQYLVVEWEAQVPQHVSDSLTGAAMLKAGEGDIVKLETCFKWYSEVEEISDFYCQHCKANAAATKKVEFWSFPPVLLVQLKRFEWSGTGMHGITRGKITSPVQFPLEGLDLSQSCLSSRESFPRHSCLRAGQQVVIHGLKSEAGQKMNGLEGKAMYLDTSSVRFCVRLHEDDPLEEWKKVRPDNLQPVAANMASAKAPQPVFDLLALSKHIGASSTNFGHYVAFARSSVDGIWRLFDDEKVTEVTAQEVASQYRDAYVLVYIRRDLRPACWGPAPFQTAAG